ncbi:MAG: double-stranded RNA binding motif domain-containing protein, partial [Thermoguttaceae bacterium]
EFCMRTRTEPPLTEIRQEGAFFEATMTLRRGDEQLQSGPFRAASKKTAEQLAAEALLEMISRGGDEALPVGDDQAARLQAANPKGRLLEWCAKAGLPPPDFQRDASPQGYRIRAVVTTAQGPMETGWYLAQKLKVAEQAAAEAALGQLPPGSPPASTTPALAAPAPPDSSAPTPPDSSAPAPASAAADAPPKTQAGRNAPMVLNELAQAGLLEATGYELLDQSGPSHQPTFVVVAWARLPGGRMVGTDPTQAPSKKTAQRLAAERLLDLLVEQEVTR